MGMGGPRQGLMGRGGAGKGGGITSLMQQQHAQPPMQQVNSPALPAGYDPNVHVPSIGFMPGMQPAQPSMGQLSMGQPGQPGAMQAAQHAAAEARYQAQQPMVPPSNPGEMRDFGVMPSNPLSMQYRQNAQRLENEYPSGTVPDSMRQMPMGGFGQPDQASMQAQIDQMAAMQGGDFGARTRLMPGGTEAPEQLAMMGANQSRSPQERTQAMQGEAFAAQQNSFDQLNAARQAGFQVGPTPNQVPNPYAGMSTGAMQQMNEQMRMQQMQQSPFGSQMRMQQMQQSPFGSQMRLPPQMQQSPFGSQMRLPPQMMNPQRYGGKGGSGGIHGLSSLFARQRFQR